MSHTNPLYLCCSRACPGHHELRHGERSSDPHHVVSAGPFPQEIGSGERLHQEPGQEHRQQGHVRHLLGVRKHPLLQGAYFSSFGHLYEPV